MFRPHIQNTILCEEILIGPISPMSRTQNMNSDKEFHDLFRVFARTKC